MHARGATVLEHIFEPLGTNGFILLIQRCCLHRLIIRSPSFSLKFANHHIFMVCQLLPACQEGIKPGREWIFQIASRHLSVPHPAVNRNAELVWVWLIYGDTNGVIATTNDHRVSSV